MTKTTTTLSTFLALGLAGCMSGDDTDVGSSGAAVINLQEAAAGTLIAERGDTRGLPERRDLGEPCLALHGCDEAGEVTEHDLEPLPVDRCDDAFADASWQTVYSQNFDLHVLPGTAADTDIEAIAAAREQAYAEISAALGIDNPPIIDVYLSPNRVAADAHGVGKGNAYPSYNRYDVIYTGAPDGYETVRYGHELTHVLAYHLPTDRPWAMPVLNEGLAEYFDQSDRDLHEAYVLQLNADRESRRHLAELDAKDVSGKNYGRAGSLAQAIIDRHGMDRFLAIYKYTHLSWSSGCYRHPDYDGCVNSPGALTALLDQALRAYTDEDWSQFQAHWDATVREALHENGRQLHGADREAIEDLVQMMDVAINDKSAELYRTTMDGFYCDWGGEKLRTDVSNRVVTAYDDLRHRVIAVYPTGIKNFSTAYALVERTEGRGVTYVMGVQFERVDGTWRQTWGPDWE